MPYSKTLTRAKPLSTRHLKKCVSTSAAGPDPFIRRPNPVQNPRGWTPARGKDAAKTAPHPVRWSHNTRTARRRVRCGGRDKQKRDTAYPGECRREHISFPCVPPWWGRYGSLILANPTQIAKQEAIVCMEVPVGHWQQSASIASAVACSRRVPRAPSSAVSLVVTACSLGSLSPTI